ncbi:uncharacterized protein LOC111009442 isoform X2 [Momordica charantia]|uniref:Uncharacterized protein LOC111009442 isoform X2 n=1 Tax=Momordica charantia TaxID=3673 RepID=A0A6J1CAH3_MOMCH|nr:uncharacterized protein LOC111009442 isoform X2 [Momordica charantia]
MALRVNCSASVFLLPRAPDSNSFDTSKAARLSLKEGEGSWRSRCALGLASLILAIEFGNAFVAGEIQALESPPPPQLVDSRRMKISRWSDKRKCAPWRANSLENIVPENLPRPSQRRKWETVTFTVDVETNAPAIQGQN